MLGPRAALFKRYYDVSAEGNWEGHTILNRLNSPALGGRRDRSASWPSAGRCSSRAREPRVRPGRDDKVLADWNGLMIAALAKAGLVFDRPDWIATRAGAPSTPCAAT